MSDSIHDVLLKYPPREIDPVERQLIDKWLALAGDISVAYVSGRKSDDPALFRRLVIAAGPGDQPTHLIHAPVGLRLWVKLTVGGMATVEMFDTLLTALNSIRRVLD